MRWNQWMALAAIAVGVVYLLATRGRKWDVVAGDRGLVTDPDVTDPDVTDAVDADDADDTDDTGDADDTVDAGDAADVDRA
jgi:hypothetical protein